MTASERPLPVFLPGALAAVRDVQNAAGAGTSVCSDKWPQHLGNIKGVGRGGEFVRYGLDVIVLTGALHHPIDEARPVRTEDPGGAHDKMVWIDGQHLALAFQLRFA